MSQSHRREFLQEVSGGMLAVLVGPSLAAGLGFAAEDDRDNAAKTPAGLGRLSRLIQETPTKDLLPALHTELKGGVSLKELIAAGALANARAFGGQDYNGYHSFMALCPSYAMAQALPEKESALPVLKVLYRTSTHIHGAAAPTKTTSTRSRRPSSMGGRPRANVCARRPAPASSPTPSRSSPPSGARRNRPTTTYSC